MPVVRAVAGQRGEVDLVEVVDDAVDGVEDRPLTVSHSSKDSQC